jgi:glycosyltransferase involved in cell wall biosynthesis
MLRRYLVENKIDILHLFNNRSVSNGILAARHLPIKIIAYRGIVGNVSYFNPASWMTYLHPRVDRIICVAEAVRQSFLNMQFLWRRFPQDKPVTIHKGHDLAWYHAEPENLSQFGIAPTDFVVGSTANYRPRKGLHVLIEAMNHLPSESPIHLLLIGDIKTQKLLNQIRRNEKRDRIHLTGYRKDAPAVQAACKTVVLPALRREGLPKVVIEAMAYGIPPIVTDSGGSPELIEDGISGIIVQPGNPQEIASAIMHLYRKHEDRMRMGINARKRIASCFRIETTIQQTLQVYKGCLNRSL